MNPTDEWTRWTQTASQAFEDQDYARAQAAAALAAAHAAMATAYNIQEVHGSIMKHLTGGRTTPSQSRT